MKMIESLSQLNSLPVGEKGLVCFYKKTGFQFVSFFSKYEFVDSESGNGFRVEKTSETYDYFPSSYSQRIWFTPEYWDTVFLYRHWNIILFQSEEQDKVNSFINEEKIKIQEEFKVLRRQQEEERKKKERELYDVDDNGFLHPSEKLKDIIGEEMHGYHSDLPLLFLRNQKENNKTQRYFGIEIEIKTEEEFDGQYDTCFHGWKGVGYFKSERDGSVENGGEFISMPFTEKYYHSVMNDKIRELINSINSSYVDEACGLHVHISKNSMSEQTLCRLFYFMNNDMWVRQLELVAGRGPNSFCYKDRNAKKYEVKGKKSAKNLYTGVGRYQIVNLCREKTVEIRLFASSSKSEVICGRVEFVICLLKYLELTSGTYDKNISWDGFSQFARLYKEEYPNLNLILINNNI